jgi:hypothetical protein
VRARVLDGCERCAPFRGARAQPGQEEMPLERELAARDGEPALRACAADALRWEPVTAALGLDPDGAQVVGDRAGGPGLDAEADELGMVPVAPGASAQDGLREQRFAPEGDDLSMDLENRRILNHPRACSPA